MNNMIFLFLFQPTGAGTKTNGMLYHVIGWFSLCLTDTAQTAVLPLIVWLSLESCGLARFLCVFDLTVQYNWHRRKLFVGLSVCLLVCLLVLSVIISLFRICIMGFNMNGRMENGENCIMWIFMICALERVFVGHKNPGRWNGSDNWHVYREKGKMFWGFLVGKNSRKERLAITHRGKLEDNIKINLIEVWCEVKTGVMWETKQHVQSKSGRFLPLACSQCCEPCCRLDDPGTVPNMTKKLFSSRKCPDRFCGSPNILLGGYQKLFCLG